MKSAPIVLVPGFWLGAWAWDEVAAALRADGHEVTAVTLPGLESADADRSKITMSDHVEARVVGQGGRLTQRGTRLWNGTPPERLELRLAEPGHIFVGRELLKRGHWLLDSVEAGV